MTSGRIGGEREGEACQVLDVSTWEGCLLFLLLQYLYLMQCQRKVVKSLIVV